MSERQRTLAGPVELSGTGVHSGEPSRVRMLPAEEGTGVRFRRMDLDGRPEIPADLDHVVDTRLGTSIGIEGAEVLTVEHLMAALAARYVDNAVVEIDGPEPPIRDGSFAEFLAAIDEAGVEEQNAPAPIVEVGDVLHVQGGPGVSYVCTPHDGYRVSATIDFDHPAIGRQYASFDFGEGAFPGQVAPARTFGFREDGEALRQKGRALGASLANTIVLDATGVLNDEGLRFDDEFVRHKIGDVVGDLALLGSRIRGHIVAERPSHEGNVILAKALREHVRVAAAPIVDAARIMEYLPHRYPMLLVDRIVDFEVGKRIVGIKNVTINEPFFQGHYPGHPIMPGVLIIEAMAQAGGLLLMDAVDDPEEKVVYFMSLDNVKWRRPVLPGDQLVMELELLKFRRGVCRMRGVARVAGDVVAEAELMARVMDK